MILFDNKKLVHIFIWSCSILIILILFISDKGVLYYYTLKHQKNKYQEQIIQLEKKKNVLIEKINAIKNGDDYFEFLARDQLDLIKPDEIIFHLQYCHQQNNHLECQ